MIIEVFVRMWHPLKELFWGKLEKDPFLSFYFYKWSSNDLKFPEKLLFNEIYMVWEVHDGSTFFELVARLKKSNFFEIFLKFQAKFTP